MRIRYLFSVGIKEGFEVDNVWVRDESHDLELTVLKEGACDDSGDDDDDDNIHAR